MSTVRDVAVQLPARRPSSARRTTDIQVAPRTAWDGELVLAAAAQDSTFDDQGLQRAAELIRLQATMSSESVVTGLESSLPAGVSREVVGQRAVSGFRARLRGLEQAGLHPDSLAAALLDDLPAVRLISGYGRMMETDLPPGPRPTPLLGVCRGWDPAGTANRLAQAGERLLSGAPAAPVLQSMLDDPADFHTEAPSVPSSMRRRRILEVARHGSELDIYSFLRDSHVDAAGRESSLHEYELRAVVGADSLVLSGISAQPRALPFPECPLASANVDLLLGTSLHDLDGSVKSRLGGTRGCTHLSDVLRFLRFVTPLSHQLLRSEA